MAFHRYIVNVSLADSEDPDTWDMTTEIDADPGETVAAIQVLHPDWAEINIVRIYHPDTEKK